jgi:nitrogen regulatory protein PII
VLSAIADAAFTGNSGDGIVTIEDISDVYNIASKKRGNEAL